MDFEESVELLQGVFLPQNGAEAVDGELFCYQELQRREVRDEADLLLAFPVPLPVQVKRGHGADGNEIIQGCLGWIIFQERREGDMEKL